MASDLSAFHRVDDPLTLDGPRYFMLARRLAAYTGVMAARVLELRQAEESGGKVPARGEQAVAVSEAAALAELADLGMLER